MSKTEAIEFVGLSYHTASCRENDDLLNRREVLLEFFLIAKTMFSVPIKIFISALCVSILIFDFSILIFGFIFVTVISSNFFLVTMHSLYIHFISHPLTLKILPIFTDHYFTDHQ
jgi:hypothetical protein